MATEYIYSETLNQMFRDKDTAEPLAGGKIFFYKDKDRTTLKPVYKQTGNPGNYTFTVYETNQDGSIPVNSYGTLDHGLYLYPFNEAGDEELYYIVVQNINGVEQFDREGFPNIKSNSGPSTTGLRAFNYIFNGQFLYHIILAAGGGFEQGEIRQPITDVAPGEWTFERDSSTSAKDFVLFTRFNQYNADVPENPRYAINLKCDEAGSGENIKALRNRFHNVNFFASTNGSVTVAFYAKSNEDNKDLNLSFIRHYGQGGSADDEVQIGDITITTEWKQYIKTFQPGTTENKTIGPGDDDYSQFSINLPLDETFDLEITNVLWYDGNVANPAYETTRPIEDMYQSHTLIQPGKLELNAAPADFGFWMLCDGRAISRTTYYKLFQRIGTVNGPGDGSTTFNIPDCRGRVLVGAGQGSGLTNRLLGQTGGDESHILTVDEIPAHDHSSLDVGRQGFDGGGEFSAWTKTQGGGLPVPAADSPTDNTGGGLGHNNMQPFIVGNIFIYTGVI